MKEAEMSFDPEQFGLTKEEPDESKFEQVGTFMEEPTAQQKLNALLGQYQKACLMIGEQAVLISTLQEQLARREQ